MDPLAQALKSSQKSQNSQQQFSPLDKGFETEQALAQQNQPQPTEGLNPLASALSRSGSPGIGKDGKSALDQQNQLDQAELMKQQQLEAEKKAKKEALRKKLHEKVNPLDLHDVYSQREAKTKQELEQVRATLKSMMGLQKEMKQFYKEVDIAVYNQITDQGQTGIGLKIFFEKLRKWIEFLRQKVHSARTWLQQSQAKSQKKKARKGRMATGIEIGGSQHEQTKAVFDQMHHETSSSYSGS